MARETGLEPATSTVTGWYSNQLSYSPALTLRNAVLLILFNIAYVLKKANQFSKKTANFLIFQLQIRTFMEFKRVKSTFLMTIKNAYKLIINDLKYFILRKSKKT